MAKPCATAWDAAPRPDDLTQQLDNAHTAGVVMTVSASCQSRADTSQPMNGYEAGHGTRRCCNLVARYDGMVGGFQQRAEGLPTS